MQRQIMNILAGGIILLTPFVPQVSWAQAMPGDPLSAIAGIELTQQQEAQLTQIRTQTRSQIASILTPQQRQEFKASLEQREGLRSAIQSINLSPEQKTQLREILQTTRSQLAQILTPEQRRQLIKNWRLQNSSR